jgi:CubicO group peptidase (beta-lactamase class C family)/dihydroorotase-like cyclic amidohydrolase
LHFWLILAIASTFCGAALAADNSTRYEVVIKGGRVVDGTGAPWYVADVGIRGGKIVRIGRIESSTADVTIDAKGLIVAPGFVDMMGQTATPMLEEPKTATNLLSQGITTINAGEGSSAAPLDKKSALSFGWETMSEYFQLLEMKGLPVNVVQTVGHTQVRRIVLGELDRRPSDDEMKQMKMLVREAMEAGAIGVSTALIYPPAVYARTEEIAQLAAVAGEYGGRYYTHMRNEGDLLLEAIDEALEIGRTANTPVHIFHLKAAGRQNWGKMQLAIARIKAARAEGGQVTADIYPYVHNVRDLGAISLEQAISQASAAATNNVLVYDRGRIAQGQAADVIVFDFEQLADRATFAKPHEIAKGMKYVLVNGTLVWRDGQFTGQRPGRVLRGPGYQLSQAAHAVSTGHTAMQLQCIDRVLQAFMEKHHVPGGALAITDGGRLVYARGFGYADVATRQPVTPESLFRIASISKPVTATAIMQLVEQNKLNLDDKVFDLLDFEPHLESGVEFDKRQQAITIRHLLQHRGGWDRDRSFDAMFQSVRFANMLNVPAPAAPTEVIRAMLGQQLDFDPGHRYAYSNYGYCLLGRVIEVLGGKPYETHVRENVLAPLGITSMRIGSTRLAGRQPNEVRYYHPEFGTSVFADDLDQRVPQPYGAWYLEAMDSHGAWIASAVDLARFGCAFDSADNCPILGSEFVRAMFERPPGLAGHDKKSVPKLHYYGFGWSVDVDDAGQISASHSGSLPGTNTCLIRRHDGRNVVILFNTRVSPFTSRVVNTLLDVLQPAINDVDDWPDHDLFDQFR